jgi:predicted Rdx family selenoprotein
MGDTKNPKKKPSIQITYCVEGGHLDIATSLAAAIKDKLGITAKLKKGHGGIFQVTMDGKVLGMKAPCCGFPGAEQIIERAKVLIKTRNVSDDDESSDWSDTCCDPSSHNSCCG